jgi:hypothetical protein
MAYLPRASARVLRKGCVVLVETRVFMTMEGKDVLMDKQRMGLFLTACISSH